jgi:serine/threonine protein kinase
MTISCIIVGIVHGMKYLHSKNIIHRDLRPGNLLLDGDNFRIRICNFGSSVYEDYETRARIGTLAYLSPESFDDHPTKKVDVFVFGLILFELLCGESVFPKDADIARIYALHAREERPNIPEGVSPTISGLIQRCWSPEGRNRPTFEEIYSELEGIEFVFFDDVDTEVVFDYVRTIKSQEGQI